MDKIDEIIDMITDASEATITHAELVSIRKAVKKLVSDTQRETINAVAERVKSTNLLTL